MNNENKTGKILISMVLLLVVGLLMYWFNSVVGTQKTEEKPGGKEVESQERTVSVKNLDIPERTEEKEEKDSKEHQESKETADNKEESREKPTAEEMLVEAMKKARETNCPLLALIYNDSEASSKTKQNIKDPTVQQALGDMELVMLHKENFRHRVEYMAPSLIVLEPWATEMWREKTRRRKYFDQKNRETNKSVDLNLNDVPLPEAVDRIGKKMDMNISPSLFTKEQEKSIKITMNLSDPSPEEVLSSLEEHDSISYRMDQGIIWIVNTEHPSVASMEKPEALSKENLLQLKLAEKSREDVPIETRLDKEVIKQLKNNPISLSSPNASMEELLKKLTEKTGKSFVFDRALQQKVNDGKGAGSVSIAVKKLPGLTVLKLVADMKNLDYYMKNGEVVVTEEIQGKEITVPEILDFLARHGCKQPIELGDEKRYQIREHLRALELNGKKRKEAIRYLSRLKPTSRSLLRERIRNTRKERVKDDLGQILSRPQQTNEKDGKSK